MGASQLPKDLYDEFSKQSSKQVRKERKKVKQDRKEQPKQWHIDYTIQVVCDAIVPHIYSGCESYAMTYRVVAKDAYGTIPPHYLNNARIHIRKGKNGWAIGAQCINGTEVDESEGFKLVIPALDCKDLVELARIYTVAWNKNFHDQYSNALKYLPYLQHLQQNTQSCSTD